MLAKRYRFHGHNSLRFVYSKGKTVRGTFVSMKYVKNNRRTESRLAVVVSKKVTKKAPIRNRIRRRIYEAMRLRWAIINPGYDIVITVFDERIASMPHDQLSNVVNELLKNANILIA